MYHHILLLSSPLVRFLLQLLVILCFLFCTFEYLSPAIVIPGGDDSGGEYSNVMIVAVKIETAVS